jgi:hypothetical protein
MGARGLLLSGPLNADTEYGKAGEYAVYVVAPYGDYFVMVYGFAPSAEQEGIRSDVEGYLGGFAIDTAPAPVVSK